MKIYKVYILSILLSLSYVSFVHAQKTSSWYDSSFATIGGNQLLVFSAGKGKNTIVFESGLGVNGKAWFTHKIFKTFSANNQVILYNRAGYAPSSIGDEPRSLQQLANDLKEVIQKFSINKQVIIVGHSLGGSIARTFTIQNPDMVKALMFIDTNHEKYTPYANMAQTDIDDMVASLISIGETGAAMEAKELINNLSLLRSLPNLPDIPVTVLTSVKMEEGSTQGDIDDWAAAHASLGNGVGNFIQIKTTKSGHFIYEEEPELVVKYLRKLLK